MEVRGGEVEKGVEEEEVRGGEVEEEVEIEARTMQDERKS